MKKRLFASVLAVCMLVSLIPTTALAAGGTPCTTTGCTHVAAISDTHYDSLDDAVADVQPGDTIKLLRDIKLADDTQIRIISKGTNEDPITLDFNGKTITGNNSNTDKPNKAAAKSGILFLDGCYINLVDTSTTGTKGGVVNNTIASSGMVSALVVISYSATGSNVTINDGLRFEADKGASARGIYHYRGNNAEIHLTINDAYVRSGGYVLDYTKLNGSGEVTINGGTFISKKGNNLSPFYGSAYLYINGGTFHNWGSSDIQKVTDGHTISMAENNGKYIYAVISEANAPTDYVASMRTSSGKTVYMIPKNFAIGNKNSGDADGYMLTLELEDGVKLTGSVPLYSADVIVTGSGDASDFSCVPINDKFEMTVNGENGVYSCRMKVDGGEATLIKTDGTKIGYATASGAMTAAEGDPGSVVVLNKNISTNYTAKLGASADVTLDMNGHNYKFENTGKDAFQLTNGAKLTITNSNESKTGTFIATGRNNTKANSAILTKNPGGGTIVIGENVTVKGPIVLLGEGSKVTVAGTVDATGLKEFAISGNGTAGQGNTEITIQDTAVVKSDSNCPAIYHPQAGTLTVEGGTIQGGTGIEMRAGTLNVSGGTITGTAATFTKAANGSGNTTHGVGIAVSQHGTNLPITVNIVKTGKTPPVISGQYALYEEDLQDTMATDKININITDGEFRSTATGESAKAVYSENVKNFISGGYFTSDPSKYVVADKAAVASDKAGYSHMVGEKSVEDDIIVKPATKAPSVDSAIEDGTAKNEANTSANTVSAPAIVDAANKEARELTQEEKQKVAETLKADPGTEVIIYAQTYLDIQTTEYDSREDTLSLSMDITPKMQLIASTAQTADGIVLDSTGKNSVTYGAPQKLTITTPTQISLTLPSTFADKTVYIKHEASNGKTYYYTAQADNTANITFTSQHGFSPFTFLTKNEAAAEVNGIGYPTLQDAVNAVQDGQTIKVLKDGDSATVSRKVKFTVAKDTGVTNYTITVTGNYKNQSTAANEYDIVPTGSSGGSGSGTTTYAITVNSPANGTVTATPKSVAKGATVTLTVAPTEGYQLDKLTVADKDGKEIALTDKGDGKYTFTMPASKVDVTATFKEVSATHVCPSEKYTDVDTSQWYHEGVDYVIANGMMNGTGTNIFEPNATTTRGMIVTILYRLEKEPAAGTSPFTDVDAGQWYAKAVAWAAESGVVNGTSPTTFNPNDPITREQMAAILYRYASFKGYDVTGKADLAGFTDAAQISDYAKDPMSWANQAGLIGGVSANTLQPQGSATRAQVATILMRFCENVAK